MAIDSDEIQFLSSDSAETYVEATYAGSDYPAAYRGWWDFNDVGGTSLDDEEFANGTAFLVYNGSGNDIVFQYSGQVPTGSALTITIPAGTTTPFVCNPTPVDLVLSQITAEGMAIDSDEFQFLDDTNAETYIEATYAGTEYPAAYRGWWDFNDVGGTPLDDQELPAGAAILGYIGSGNEVVVQFPAIVP